MTGTFQKTLLMLLYLVWVSPSLAQIVQGQDYIDQVSEQIINIDTAQLQEIIANEKDLVLIDVRTEEEIAISAGTIDAPRNFNIPRGWLEFRVPERLFDTDIPIVVFCNLNLRSPLAAKQLMDMGYSNVKNYADGFINWRDQGMPVETDDSPVTMLYRKPQQVAQGVWSAIGATAPPTYHNSGHNNNLSFIITDDGVVVVNAGDNYLLAESLHHEIKQLTDQPVKYVILENGQGHAMLGSNYWQQQGAQIIAHTDTADEIEEFGEQIIDRMRVGRRDKAVHTQLTVPDITFDESYVIELGGQKIEVKNLGPAHSPGDIVVWLPEKKLVISGDMAFHQRLLPVFEHTDTDGWIDSWSAFLDLDAEIVIPGHGAPTDYSQVTKYTHDYLVFMREKIGEIIDDGGDLQDAYEIDQTQYSHLDTYYELAKQNAGRIYREMEFEF